MSELPQGYQQRAEAHTKRILYHAIRLMDIGDEFGGDNAVLGDDNLTITITKVKPKDQ